MGLSYPIFRLPNYPQATGTRPGEPRVTRASCCTAVKPRQHMLYVYASLSRLDFQGLAEKFLIVSEGVTGFSTVKKPTALMMHWCKGGHGGVCAVNPAGMRCCGWTPPMLSGKGMCLPCAGIVASVTRPPP